MKSEVRAGETVPLKLTVKNASDRPVELGLGGREDTGFAGSYDFVVAGADGTELWRWSAGKVFQAILSLKALEAGEVLEFEGEWDQRDNEGRPVPATTYYVHGVLHIRLEVSTPQEEGVELKTEAKPLIIVP